MTMVLDGDLAIMDVTSNNQTTTVASSRRVDPVMTNRIAGDRSGQNAPASGTHLPVNGASRAESVELPELERLAESITQFVRSMDRDLTFSVHEASGRTVVTVLDGATKEVIKQIPSEEFLRMSEALATSRSLLLDTEA